MPSLLLKSQDVASLGRNVGRIDGDHSVRRCPEGANTVGNSLPHSASAVVFEFAVGIFGVADVVNLYFLH